MRIGTAQGLGLLAANQQTSTLFSKILEKLATGKQINRASDDAAGLSIAEELRTQVRGFEAASTNVDYAQASQNIAEGTGNEVSGLLQRQRELALQSSNGTLTDTERGYLNTEYQQLGSEIDRIAKSSQFNGMGNAAGTEIASGTAQVMVSPNPGQGSMQTMPQVNFTAANLGINATDISSMANAQNAIGQLDTAMNTVNTQRSNLGASMNVMESTKNTITNSKINSQAAESQISDLDFAQGVMEQTRASLLNQTSTMALKNFNEINRNNMMALLG